MTVFLLTLILLALGIVGMCFNILFRKDGSFPQYEVGSNEQMRKLGIRCMKEEMEELDRSRDGRKRDAASCSGREADPSCAGCNLYKKD